jgi:hypothetical protein
MRRRLVYFIIAGLTGLVLGSAAVAETDEERARRALIGDVAADIAPLHKRA